VTKIDGLASFSGPNEITVDGPDGKRTLTADHIVIAVSRRRAGPRVSSVFFSSSSLFRSDDRPPVCGDALTPVRCRRRTSARILSRAGRRRAPDSGDAGQ
jgi:hypothetical protein